MTDFGDVVSSCLVLIFGHYRKGEIIVLDGDSAFDLETELVFHFRSQLSIIRINRVFYAFFLVCRGGWLVSVAFDWSDIELRIMSSQKILSIAWVNR